VVKADGYGLGAAPVARALAAAGCADFFVASVDEGTVVREALGPGPRVFVMSGLTRGTAGDCADFGLTPVLLSPEEVEIWAALCAARGPLPAGIKIDTGMNRLGMAAGAFRMLVEQGRLAGFPLALVMSHLACADMPDHPLNAAQRADFAALAALVPGARASLANSAGIFLGGGFHFDVVRPGGALYGLWPLAAGANELNQVVHLKAKILQVHDVDRARTVGYGATRVTDRRSRLATVAIGYADGFLRSLSNCGFGFVGGDRVPLVGRVSMDLSTFDVTDVPEARCRPGTFIDIVCDRQSVDDLARAAGTIGYEVLTRLARRIDRVYIDD
jgi:alanine racemase